MGALILNPNAYAPLTYGVLASKKIIRWFDPSLSLSALADTTAVSRLPDLSGNRGDLVQFTTSKQPTKTTSGGLAWLSFGATHALNSLGDDTTIYPQPLTLIAVVKGSASLAASGIVFGGDATSGRARIVNNSTTFCADGVAGSTAAGCGPALNDNAVHVVVVVLDLSTVRIYVDGWLMASAVTQTAGTEGFKQPSMGNVAAAGNQYLGLVGDCIAYADRLNATEVRAVTAALSSKWGGQSTGYCAASAPWEDTTSSNGQSVRVFTPTTLTTPTTLVIFTHKQGGTPSVGPGNFEFSLAAAAVNKGWIFAATNAHGDSWSNANAQADILDLYNLINGRSAVSKVIIIGESMGALAAAALVAAGTIPHLAGVYCVDGALSLRAMYANATYTANIDTAYGITRSTLAASSIVGATTLSSNASYAAGKVLLVSNGTVNAELVTVISVSGAGPYTLTVAAMANAHTSADQIADYGTQTSGLDPYLKTADSLAVVPWRFLASTSDVNVIEATNTDAMRTLLATAGTPPTEYGLVTHTSTHLTGNSFQPADFAAFALRCGAGV